MSNATEDPCPVVLRMTRPDLLQNLKLWALGMRSLFFASSGAETGAPATQRLSENCKKIMRSVGYHRRIARRHCGSALIRRLGCQVAGMLKHRQSLDLHLSDFPNYGSLLGWKLKRKRVKQPSGSRNISLFSRFEHHRASLTFAGSI